jgi:D-alanyl-lipoteichoic acid acyltransferase DltB (MBOAT superfamily)
MKNFDHPYTATSVKEFWSRWHISLSSWFKDYLYIPLGGNRRGKPRQILNVMIVFLVSGLWHGAAWTFVIWGALHGVYQVVGTLTWKKRNELLGVVGLSKDSFGVVLVRRALTFVLVTFAWLFFRANSMGDAVILLKKLSSGFGTPFGESLSAMKLGTVALVMTVLLILTLYMIDRLLTYDDRPDGSALLVRDGAFVYFIWIVMFVWVLLLSKGMSSTFIYFQF